MTIYVYNNESRPIEITDQQGIPNIRFDIYGMNNVQPVWADNFKRVISKSKMAINLRC